MKKIIEDMYGSVDKMIETNNISISRSYIYQILSGEKDNITINVAKEFVKVLNLKSIDEFVKLLELSKK